LGRPAYLLRLIPRRSLLPPWSAGDIAEIRPRNDPWRVTQYLSACGLNPDDKVGTHTLEEHLAASIIPDASFLPMSAEELVSQLRPLPAREYSIASVWMDGALELVVRQIVKPQGLGCASGWLTSHVSLADSIDLRIRRNPGFHRPREGPMILIGNGTGIAGLRAHLRDSHFRGNGGHWLLFGERHRARDAFFRHEIDRWLTRGTLARFDPAWSRDDLNRRYVQHLMRENAKLVQSWISSGASIMVSGSAKGMAPAVDSVLRDILGDTRLDQLAAEGFYRRDVY
jgi:sulfite reductase (NADPH) flavoprotein alpha-component